MVRRASLVMLGLLAGCGGKVAGSALLVIVEAPDAVPADCIEVSAFSAAGNQVDTSRFTRDGRNQFRVAVYPGGELESAEVFVEARGFTGTACDQPSSSSERKSAVFAPGLTTITVTLAATSVSADGGGVDAGASDAGEADAGGRDAGEGDAGEVDAGDFDAGASDAGPSDAGTGDAGPIDAGGLFDAGPDAGGAVDAGPVDAGGCGGSKPAGAACAIAGICALDDTCAPRFTYPPSNFDPIALTNVSGIAELSCDTTFDSTALTFSANFCNELKPIPVVLTQDGGSDVVVLPMAGLTVRTGRTLTLTGGRPVIIAVFGDATIVGTVLAQAGPDQPDCAASHGTPGALDNSGPGAGGAGFGGFGGDGGAALMAGGIGGLPHGNAALVPLTGGCSGALGGATPRVAGGAGGRGGGAVQLSVAGTLTVTGRVGAPGAGGRRGISDNNGGSGGGGAGSGGAILLEGQRLIVQAALLTANGGGGGEGGGTSNTGIDGLSGSLTSATPALGGNANPPTFPGFGGNGGAGITPAGNGLNQRDPAGGGGAGGGGVGRIRLNALLQCQVDGGVISPPATASGCP